MTTLLLVYLVLLGCCVGSFCNVVVTRMPEGESIVQRGSACPGCGHAIAPYDNIPVVSWLVLRGRCRACRMPIPVRYPLVELAGGALFALLGAYARPVAVVPTALVVFSIALASAVIDLRTQRLLDRLSAAMGIAALVGLGLTAALTGDWGHLGTAAVGAAIVVVILVGVHRAVPRGVSAGAATYAPALAAVVGYGRLGSVAVMLAVSLAIASVVGIRLGLVSRRVRILSGSAATLGPALFLGALVAACAGSALWEAFLSLVT